MGVSQQRASNAFVSSQHLNASKTAPRRRCMRRRYTASSRASLSGCPSPIVRLEEVGMAVITINDLPQSDELDREAMQSIAGGARPGARRVQIVQAMAGSGRIVDYPPGFGR